MNVEPGTIIVLNGAPRSGKSSIVRVMQDTFDGPWMNLGVDTFVLHVTPSRYRPGIGLRPVESDHPAAQYVATFYSAMYESIAAHSRLGLNVVTDVGHHDSYGRAILVDCARRLEGLPAYFIGVRCPIEVIMQRRNAGQAGREGMYAVSTHDDPIPEPVRRWQDAVHIPGLYDLDVDTSLLTPEESASAIHARVESGPPDAFRTIASTQLA